MTLKRYAVVPTVPGPVAVVEDYDSELVIGKDIVHADQARNYYPCPDAVEPGYQFDGTTFTAPPAPDQRPANKAQAAGILAENDKVAIRCGKAGVSYPAAWLAYDAALRPIAGTGTLPPAGWPAQPPYPAGT